tara:strand:- start:49 stop:699 length:651 start_codon:yes stop_codon:yes gene_type:complete
MKITILCTDASHPVIPYLEEWKSKMNHAHDVEIIHTNDDISDGDILFLVSCAQLINSEERKKYKATLVLHASDLPKGRGWSPHIWSIINGMSEITVCVLEANDNIDSGLIWLKEKFHLQGHELLSEINKKLFQVELNLMSQVVERFDKIKAEPQIGVSDEHMRRRTHEDSRLDPNKTIAEQFDLLRVVDSNRFPAFMDFRGKRYILKIEKINDDLV